MKSLVRLGIPFLGGALFACVPEEGTEPIPISSGTAALTAAENVEHSLTGVVDAADFLASSSSIAATLNAMGGAGESCESSGYSCYPEDTSCPEPETVCTSDELTEADLQELRSDLRELAQEISQELRDRVFTEANLESETETSATFRLGPDIVCGSDDYDDAPAIPSGDGAAPTEGDALAPPPEDEEPAAVPEDDEAPEYDPDCLADLERQQPRLRLTSVAEGDIDVSLLLGEARHVVATLQLYRNSLGLTVDAGAAFRAAVDIGEQPEDIESMRGVGQVRLVRNGDRDYSLQYNVLEEIEIRGTDEDDNELLYSLAPSSPMWELRVDGVAESLTASLDMGRLLLSGPLAAFAGDLSDDDASSVDAAPLPYPDSNEEPAPPPPEEEQPAYHGVLELLLSGLSGTITYTGDDDTIQLSNLGLGTGTSRLSHDGNTLIGVDLNAAAGRRFNLLVEALEGSGARLTFDPSFEMQVQLGFQHLQDQIADLGGFLLDDTLTIGISGDSPTIEMREGGIQVISGELNLTSSSVPDANVSVPEGMCLLGMDDEVSVDAPTDEASDPEPAAGGHELLSELTSGMCE